MKAFAIFMAVVLFAGSIATVVCMYPPTGHGRFSGPRKQPWQPHRSFYDVNTGSTVGPGRADCRIHQHAKQINDQATLILQLQLTVRDLQQRLDKLEPEKEHQ